MKEIFHQQVHLQIIVQMKKLTNHANLIKHMFQKQLLVSLRYTF